MYDMIKIIWLIEKYGLLTKVLGFLSMLLSTLGASLLESSLKSKGIIQANEGTIRDSKQTVRAGQDF